MNHSLTRLIFLTLICGFSLTTFAASPLEIPLWPNGSPGWANQKMHETINSWGGVEGTFPPELIAYLPDKSIATGTAVMICPGGGGYRVLAIQHEGHQIARYLQSIGVAGIICKYRLRVDQEEPAAAAQRAETDAARGIQIIRQHAAEWSIDPARIGVIGFSAGGSTALNLVIHPHIIQPTTDPIEKLNSRPDFMILAYPGASEEQLSLLDEHAPPTLLVQSVDDPNVPWTTSTHIFETLLRHHVSAELHIFATGGHGFGIGQPKTSQQEVWPAILKNWLTRIPFPEPTTQPN